MSTVVQPGTSSHVRSGRFVQHERPAAYIPARMRARRLAGGARFFGARATTALEVPTAAEQESTTEKFHGWILGRLTGSRD